MPVHMLEGLTTSQTVAMDAILSGYTICESADMAGINRSCVYRWLREDVEFQTELERRRKEIRDGAQNRLLQLCGKCVSSVEDAVKAGDVRVALSVLKGLGILDGGLGAPVQINVNQQQNNVQLFENASPEEIIAVKRSLDDLRRQATSQISQEPANSAISD